MNPLKDLFLLDPDIVFLNHGSFGATPRPVFETYQAWQRRLERQPVLFLGREFLEFDRQARQALGAYLHAEPDDLVFVPNATFAVNALARSLRLGPGDEILTSDHEYGACDKTWDFIRRQTGARIVRQPICFPEGPDEGPLVEQLWSGVTPHTRLIFLSHITSNTALRFPVERICARARKAGILTFIDGAHAPGQIPLDLPATGADFYTGNCHKWMMAPKGAGFLYARPEAQPILEPLIVSWGYRALPEATTGSPFLDHYLWTGTRDPSAALSVPAAIQFMQEHNWDQVRQRCHALLRDAIRQVCEIVDLAPPYPLDSDFYAQMGIAPLPASADLQALKTRLYDEYRVEVPLTEWNGRKFIRISVQGYNSEGDLETLYAGLRALLPAL